MALFEQFPYTNYHDLNLDWLLRKMHQLSDWMDALKGRMDSAERRLDAMEDAVAQIRSDLASLEQRVAENEADIGEIWQVLYRISEDLANLDQKLDALEKKVDAFQIGEYVNIEDVFTVGDGINLLDATAYKQGGRFYGRLVMTLAEGSDYRITIAPGYNPMGPTLLQMYKMGAGNVQTEYVDAMFATRNLWYLKGYMTNYMATLRPGESVTLIFDYNLEGQDV